MAKIVLDTDIGSDIDDCFVLAYLLSRKDIEILGITTTGGKSHLRAQLAHRVCTCYGADIPVHSGKPHPMEGESRQPRLTDAQMIVASQSNKSYAEGEATAVEFLRETIEENPGEITLVCIGPLTNIGELFETYPHIPALVKEMVIMGGRYTHEPDFKTEKWGETEWNIVCDTKAAYIVFKSNIKPCTVVGVDVTCKFHISPYFIKEAFLKKTEYKAVSDSVNTLAQRVWFHDNIAIYGWLYPEKTDIKKGNIEVKYHSKDKPSETGFTLDKNGLYSLVGDFSCEEFWNNFVDITGIDLPFEIVNDYVDYK